MKIKLNRIYIIEMNFFWDTIKNNKTYFLKKNYNIFYLQIFL